MIQIDSTDLAELSADLGRVPARTQANVLAAITVSARHVKDAWREKLTGAQNLPHAPRAVSYDLNADLSPGSVAFEAIIGPNLGGQGSIVGLVEMGTKRMRARGYGHAALQEVEPDLVRGLGKAVEDAI